MGSFWDPFLGANIDPQTLTTIDPEKSCVRSCDRLVPRWPQDRSKRASGGVLGRLGAILEGSWAALGAFWGLFGRSWGSFWTVWGWFGGRLGLDSLIRFHRFDSIMRFVDSIYQFDLLMRFVDSIRALDRSMVVHHVVNTYRLNNSARRNARSD